MKELMFTKTFYKEAGLWYIDLPEFIEQGLGDKNNLLMVDGADHLLNILSDNGHEVTLKFSNHPFVGAIDILLKEQEGFNPMLLKFFGHAPVDGGAYYYSTTNKFKIWICPVTTYLFDGIYPESIYYTIV